MRPAASGHHGPGVSGDTGLTLRQLAAAILIFSGSIAFFDTKFFPRRFFRPGLAAALLLLVQSAYLIARPIRLWALCVFCMGLTAAVTDLLLRRRDRLPLLLAAEAVISREIGSGVVPLDAGERAWRERHGRLLRQLAEQAGHVYRIFCGLTEVLK